MRGFTLLELLIAIFITALLAAGTVGLVFQFSETNERVTARMDELDRLQAAKSRLATDIQQFVPRRPVADEFNNLQPALISDDETLLILTRHGWPRSVISPSRRSDLQRIEYQLIAIDDDRCRMGLTSEQWAQRDNLEGQCLIRRFRQHLEAEADNPWREQVVLAPVRAVSFGFEARDREGSMETHDEWPPSAPAGDPEPASLRAVTAEIEYGSFGSAVFRWLVPGDVLPEPDEEGQL